MSASLTLNELVYQVYESLQINADDTTLDRRLIEDFIAEERALWIRNELNKNRSIDPSIIQDLGCVEVVQVSPTTECCDLPNLGECSILRTKDPIPNSIELYQDKLITRVGPVVLTSPRYTQISLDAAPSAGHGRFNWKEVYYFLLSNHIYLFSRNNLFSLTVDTINVQGVFENPKEAARYKTCDDKPCWTPDQSYPINSWMWAQWVKPRVLEKLRPKLQLPMDMTNNAQDNIPPQAPIQNA